jgi:Ring finger domain
MLHTDYNNYCEPDDDIEANRTIDEPEVDTHTSIAADNRSQNSDKNSTDGSVETALLDDVFEDAAVGFIKIPMPGESCHDFSDPGTIQTSVRTVPGGCVICLNTFVVGDRVTWSSNKACNHLFHEECILDWLKTSGRKTLRRQRRQRESHDLRTEIDIVHEVTSVPWLCPVCRQDFIKPKQQETKDTAESKDEPNSGNISNDGSNLSSVLEQLSPHVHVAAQAAHVSDTISSAHASSDHLQEYSCSAPAPSTPLNYNTCLVQAPSDHCNDSTSSIQIASDHYNDNATLVQPPPDLSTDSTISVQATERTGWLEGGRDIPVESVL